MNTSKTCKMSHFEPFMNDLIHLTNCLHQNARDANLNLFNTLNDKIRDLERVVLDQKEKSKQLTVDIRLEKQHSMQLQIEKDYAVEEKMNLEKEASSLHVQKEDLIETVSRLRSERDIADANNTVLMGENSDLKTRLARLNDLQGASYSAAYTEMQSQQMPSRSVQNQSAFYLDISDEDDTDAFEDGESQRPIKHPRNARMVCIHAHNKHI